MLTWYHVQPQKAHAVGSCSAQPCFPSISTSIHAHSVANSRTKKCQCLSLGFGSQISRCLPSRHPVDNMARSAFSTDSTMLPSRQCTYTCMYIYREGVGYRHAPQWVLRFVRHACMCILLKRNGETTIVCVGQNMPMEGCDQAIF